MCKPIKQSDELVSTDSKSLRVTALVFAPSAGSSTVGGVGTTDGADGGSSVTKQCPPLHDGKNTWEAHVKPSVY